MFLSIYIKYITTSMLIQLTYYMVNAFFLPIYCTSAHAHDADTQQDCLFLTQLGTLVPLRYYLIPFITSSCTTYRKDQFNLHKSVASIQENNRNSTVF